MCGRYARQQEKEKLADEFEATPSDDVPAPSWNVKPTQEIAVVLESAKGEGAAVRRLEPARWSLIPLWVRDGKPKFSTFNARSEDAASKTTWKASVKSKRCLVPASGYYEWTGEKGSKIPHYIAPMDGSAVAFAGLYSWWRASDADEWMLTATILTMPTVQQLAHIHDRNPVALPKAWWATWLDHETVGDQHLVDAAVEAAVPVLSDMIDVEVRPLHGDSPELIDPV